MIRFLASVRTEAETVTAVEGGADFVDFKEPDNGALGALDVARIRACLAAAAGRCRTSATVGDWPLDAAVLVTEARLVGETGVDFVKIGLLPGDALEGCIEALGPVAARFRLVAVFFADLGVPVSMLPVLARCGFQGALVDTFGKGNGGLLDHWTVAPMADFVCRARNLGLLAGLAGSLRLEDIPVLAPARPDILGFRGALCEASDRRAAISPGRVAGVRDALARAREAMPETAP